jgi:predicted transcriptional regulator
MGEAMSAREEPGRVRDAVYEYVRAHPGRRAVEIKMATCFNWASVRTALYRLMVAGKVECEGEHEAKRWKPR